MSVQFCNPNDSIGLMCCQALGVSATIILFQTLHNLHKQAWLLENGICLGEGTADIADKVLEKLNQQTGQARAGSASSEGGNRD